MNLSRWTRMLFCAVCSCLVASTGFAQEYYTLKVPGSSIESVARIDSQELVVRDQSGQTTLYSRLRRYDTPDGRFIGYGSRQAQRVIQWPAVNQGNMRIGTLKNGQIDFTPSRMSVFAMDPANMAQLPQDGWGQFGGTEGRPTDIGGGVGSGVPEAAFGAHKAVYLAAGEPANRVFIRSGRQGQLQLVSNSINGIQGDDPQGVWMITPIGADMVRIEQSIGNQWLALSAQPQQAAPFGNGLLAQRGQSSQVRLVAVNHSIAQCWHLRQFNGGYCFESVAMPGFGLTCVPNNGLWLQPIQYTPWQIWWADQPAFALPEPGYRVLSEQIIPNAPLPAVTLRISNTHTDGLLVLLADRRNPSAPKKLRIPQGGSETVVLERDSGSTVVQTIESRDGFGNWERREVQVPVPPVVLYDVSVYEEFLQSIAIDATGKSPNVIEDVNYQPRSVGFLLLPPGDQLQDNSVIDVYRAAADSKNPGAVRRLAPSDYNRSSSQAPPKDPLKELLDQLQSKRGAF